MDESRGRIWSTLAVLFNGRLSHIRVKYLLSISSCCSAIKRHDRIWLVHSGVFSQCFKEYLRRIGNKKDAMYRPLIGGKVATIYTMS